MGCSLYLRINCGDLPRKLWQSTEKLWKVAQDQSRDMKTSIDQAIRSADAMESIAKLTGENVERRKEVFARQEQFGKMNLRAYISITPGACFPQDRVSNLNISISDVRS